MNAYFADKANVYVNQKKEDVLVCGEEVSKKIKTRAQKIVTRKSDFPKTWKLKIAGEHNVKNAAYAYAVGKVLNIAPKVMQKVFETFTGVSGRLQHIRTWKGIEFYNDATATTPDATIAALRALQKKNIVLIAGGNDKNLDFTEMAKVLTKSTKALVLFSGAATEKIKTLLPAKKEYTEVNNMKDAVKTALSFAKKGDVILLSPGATSFGIFKNEYDRRDQFTKWVKSLR
jgi:UDP-N-acetylmuramoylalanine--D-glutamate ligase